MTYNAKTLLHLVPMAKPIFLLFPKSSLLTGQSQVYLEEEKDCYERQENMFLLNFILLHIVTQ
jgi:hypothetical protein